MMKRDWHLLFSKRDLRVVLDSKLAKVNEPVLAINKERFSGNTNELLSASVASELVVSPIELLEDKISVSAQDAKVDVRYDPNRFILDKSRPVYVDGLEVTYRLPFVGDKELLNCQPSTFTYNPPRAVITSGNELTFPYDQADRDVSKTKPLFKEDVYILKQWLVWVNEQVSEYNTSLEARVLQRIQQRRQELNKTETELSALGYPVQPQNMGPSLDHPQSRKTVVAKRKSQREKKRRQYDVALSFAGENREYVELVAENLVQLGITVFYDRFETVNLWGKDLAEHLGGVYSKDAHFVVIFTSLAYANKAWPNHEKQFALSRHLKGEQGRILPIRIDDTEIPGLPGTMGYLDARVLTPEKLAELIRQKVDTEGSDA